MHSQQQSTSCHAAETNSSDLLASAQQMQSATRRAQAPSGCHPPFLTVHGDLCCGSVVVAPCTANLNEMLGTRAQDWCTATRKAAARLCLLRSKSAKASSSASSAKYIRLDGRFSVKTFGVDESALCMCGSQRYTNFVWSHAFVLTVCLQAALHRTASPHLTTAARVQQPFPCDHLTTIHQSYIS
jgi:hypothetical protein